MFIKDSSPNITKQSYSWCFNFEFILQHGIRKLIFPIIINFFFILGLKWFSVELYQVRICFESKKILDSYQIELRDKKNYFVIHQINFIFVKLQNGFSGLIGWNPIQDRSLNLKVQITAIAVRSKLICLLKVEFLSGNFHARIFTFYDSNDSNSSSNFLNIYILF